MGQAIADNTSPLSEQEREALGDGREPMARVEERITRIYPGKSVIAWEGDAATFQFLYVSRGALDMLGYPLERWLREPQFWAERVVAPADRADAVAYCALATATRRDHVFEYRAQTADGREVVLRDVVRVIVGKRGIAERLRGLMFDVTAERSSALSRAAMHATQMPPLTELEAARAALARS